MVECPSLLEQTLAVREWITNGKARELRIDNGLSLAVAAQDCEVVPAAVLHWERGRMPRGRNIAAYYRFLNRLASPARAIEPAA
jgi:hypothetical protein